MVDHVVAGRLVVEFETVPVEDVGKAWNRQAEGVHTTIVLEIAIR
jgi:hypothetical protein